MVYYDYSYNPAQTYYTNYNQNHNYSNYQHWNNNQYGNGWTAMQWARHWYPNWQVLNYKWNNNCWWVYIRYGNYYKTVCIAPNYSWHYDRDGYLW